MQTEKRQTTFAFDRAHRRSILRTARLPDDRTSRDGTRVPAARLWATLVVIEDHGSGRDCFPSVETIASEARQSVRTTERALEVLQSLGLLGRQRKRPWDAAPGDKRTLTHYEIRWPELAALARDQSAVATDQSAVATDQSAVPTKNTAHKEYNPVLGTTVATPPPPSGPKSAGCGPKSAADWTAAAERVRGIQDQYGERLEWYESILAAGRRAGLSPADVLTACEEYELQRSRFEGIGALGTRLRGNPWPVSGIRPAQAIREAREVRARAAAEAQAAAARAEEEAVAWRQELAALEAAYGAELDALAADEAEELACVVFASEFERECWRRNRRDYGRYERLVAIGDSQIR